MFLIAGARLFQIQVVKAGSFRRGRLWNMWNISAPAKRGTIYDRNGRVLATDVEAYTIYVDRRMMKNPHAVARKFEESGIIPGSKFLERLEETKSRIVTIARNVEKDKFRAVASIKGVFGIRGWGRFYPLGSIGATIIGRLNAEREGVAGIEASMDGILKGKDGTTTIILNLRNKEYRYIKYPSGSNREPINGKDIKLTLDIDLLNILDRVGRETFEKTNADRILCVVADGVTGEILGMSDIPELGETDGWVPNDLVQTEFEPGSIFKLITGAAYIESRKFLDTVFADENEELRFGKKVIKDERKHPPYDFRKCLAHSSNVGFAKMGLSLGATRIYRTALRFGLFTRTGVLLPGEKPGTPMKRKYRYDFDLALASFGQGFRVTPIQMLYAYGAVGNNGKLMKPLLVKEIIQDGKSIKRACPRTLRQVLDINVNEKLVSYLRDVLQYGTGKLARVKGLDIIGKTGTGQQSTKEGYKSDTYVCSFIGVVGPGKAPIVVGVFVFRPRGYHEASYVACPAFREIVRRMINLPQYRIRFLKEVAFGG
ncbi:penicillin-binding protein 2 [candidate division WOR-3 bacterium]|nr:penicillin-binding protein 2 [candidate division WOR-3 bacterium]